MSDPNPAPKRKAGRPPTYSPELRAVCVTAVIEEHRTPADVAREIGARSRTVERWVAAARAASPTAIPRAAPSPGAEDDGDLTALTPSGDSIEDSRAIQARLFRAAAEAERLGNSGEARKNYQEAVKLSGVIARLERERDRESGMVVTPEDIARARASVLEQIEALRRRPLLCAKCMRELLLEIAAGDDAGEID